MTKGRFILSLDCEGKWGIADHLRPEDHVLLGTARLKDAYTSICNLLDKYQIPATFAVVGLFELAPEQLLALPLDTIASRFPYCRVPVEDIRERKFDGWHGEWLRPMIDSVHEWGSHGITHTPYDQMSADDVRFEHSLVESIEGRTFIFPRNKVKHTKILQELGAVGYRTYAKNNKIGRLAGELNIFANSEQSIDAERNEIIPIPSGHFVNWKSGVRRLVPVSVSRHRAAHMLDHAAKTGGVVHFWTHPENVASAPQTLSVLAAVLEEVAIRVQRNEIRVETQMAYVQSQKNED